jgi:hypothetical protein
VCLQSKLPTAKPSNRARRGRHRKIQLSGRSTAAGFEHARLVADNRSFRSATPDNASFWDQFPAQIGVAMGQAAIAVGPARLAGARPGPRAAAPPGSLPVARWPDLSGPKRVALAFARGRPGRTSSRAGSALTALSRRAVAGVPELWRRSAVMRWPVRRPQPSVDCTRHIGPEPVLARGPGDPALNAHARGQNKFGRVGQMRGRVLGCSWSRCFRIRPRVDPNVSHRARAYVSRCPARGTGIL